MELVPMNYASFGRRALALFLDFLVVVVPAAASNIVFPIGGPVLVWFFYSPILEASEFRATLGKFWVGIQVVDLAGGRISLRTAYLRYIAKSFLGVIFIFEYLFALFTARHQTLHDLIAETTVVYGRREGSLWDAWVLGIKDLFSRFSSESATGLGTARPSSTAVDLEQLEKLQKLKESGALTEEEFQAQKTKILSRL